MDDIQSLEKLWLEARGQQSLSNTNVPQSQTTQQTASGETLRCLVSVVLAPIMHWCGVCHLQ